ncbi:hypothetical protein GCM10012279_57400 [Micromonospora yangpuensis]|nr:hypothetical protein GCM10012279_57400 [Micromonospora yangpuensis]
MLVGLVVGDIEEIPAPRTPGDLALAAGPLRDERADHPRSQSRHRPGPDRTKFTTTLRIVRRTATGTGTIPPTDWTDALPAIHAQIPSKLTATNPAARGHDQRLRPASLSGS